MRAREIAWSSLVGFHSDPKKLPKSKEKFWPIGQKASSGITESMKNRILKAQRDYINSKK